MPYRANYPATADEVLDPPVVFKQSVVDAVTNFSMNNPWQGSLSDRFAKFQSLHNSLNTIYGKNTGLVNDIVRESSSPGSSGSSFFNPSENVIHLQGKLSVVTYLHEYAHALGKDERQAVRWSLNLFRQVFPEKFRALGRGSGSSGHVVVSNRPVRVESYERGN